MSKYHGTIIITGPKKETVVPPVDENPYNRNRKPEPRIEEKNVQLIRIDLLANTQKELIKMLSDHLALAGK